MAGFIARGITDKKAWFMMNCKPERWVFASPQMPLSTNISRTNW